VQIRGRTLLVDGAPLVLKGVAWSPFAVGSSPHLGHAPDFAGFVDSDARLMQEAGINVVRTYFPIGDRAVLDVLWRHGIHVVMTVFYDSGYGHSAATAVERVCAVNDHPAIIMWAVTNEPNYYYVGVDWVADAQEVIAAVKAADGSRPVTLPHGELPPPHIIEKLPSVDVWSANMYRGVTFGGAWREWTTRSSKPFFVAEYGADSYSSVLGREDQQTHADEVRLMAREVASASAEGGGDGAAVLGGIYFAFADEWWKYSGGAPDVHDERSSWTAGGGYADLQMHEEWFGLVDVHRQKKLAFAAYAQASPPPPPPPPSSPPSPPAVPRPPLTCEDVADVLAGDYTCGERIQWLVDTYGWARVDAEAFVGDEFPTECGPCRP